jgi:hypothetical protein
MAIYTTVFVLTHDELHSCFRDVRAALAAPETRTGKNPFTGESMQFTNWDPGSANSPTSLVETHGRPRVGPFEAPETDYGRGLEGGVAPLLATFPHVAWKHIEFIELAEAILAEPSHPDYYFDCPDDEGCLQALSTAATRTLAEAKEEDIERIAATWKAEPPLNWPLEERLSALQVLQSLAKIATDTNGVLCCHLVA